MSSQPGHVKLVQLMADYALTYNPLFFGQFSLIQDWAAHWSTLDWQGHRIPIRHWYVGSSVAGPGALSVPDPTRERRAYAHALRELCAEGEPVAAFSHFIHKDATALACVSALKQQFENFHLVIVLHCTRDEFLRPWSARPAAPTLRAARQARRAEAFRRSWTILASEEGADRFVAVSEPARRSYLQDGDETPISPDRIVTIPNGVDIHHYHPAPKGIRAQRRASLGLGEGLIIGCTNRWTQAKGSDILETLLDRFEQDSSRHNVTFLFPALIHDQMFLFLESLPHRYPRLYQAGRIKAFVDVSKLKHSVFPCDMDAVRRSHLGEIEAQPEEMRGIFEQIFLGFLDYPVHTLLDVYLRPSVAEAFGLGTVEAYLCGVPVLASDRDGCGELVLPEHQVHLASDIDLRGHYHDYADPAYRAAVSKAADDLFAMLSAPSTWQVPGRELRSRMIASGYTTDSMLLRYNRLLTDLLRREGEEDVSL